MNLPTAPPPQAVRVSHCLLDADGAVLSAEGADHPFYAASTIKLHVLFAALRAADDGDLDLDRRVDATRTFRGADGRPFTLGGDHRDPTHPAEGAPVSVRELLVRMIDRSSNEATNHVLDLVGLGAVEQAIAALGLSRTRVERRIGDAAAIERGATNETSAADLARTLRALVTGAEQSGLPREATLSAAARSLARRALQDQQIRVITRALRPGVTSGSKSGTVPGYRHDVAYLGDPESARVRYLAVLTGGLEEGDADRRIQGLTRDLVPDLAR